MKISDILLDVKTLREMLLEVTKMSDKQLINLHNKNTTSINFSYSKILVWCDEDLKIFYNGINLVFTFELTSKVKEQVDLYITIATITAEMGFNSELFTKFIIQIISKHINSVIYEKERRTSN